MKSKSLPSEKSPAGTTNGSIVSDGRTGLAVDCALEFGFAIQPRESHETRDGVLEMQFPRRMIVGPRSSVTGPEIGPDPAAVW
jgi:hypothetical protein